MMRAAPFYVPQRKAPARVGGCGCGSTPTTAAVMRALGMTVAAKMHGKGALQKEWPGGQWLEHMGEEKTSLFPPLRLFASEEDAKKIDSLEDDHVTYVKLIAANLPLPSGEMTHSIEAHSKLEDALVEKYAKQLMTFAKETAGVGFSAGSAIASAVKKAGTKTDAPTPTRSTWTTGKLALLGGVLLAGGWAYGWLGAGIAGLGGALVLPKIGEQASPDAQNVIATIRLTDPSASAAKPSTVDMGLLQAQFDQEVTSYFNERNAREAAFDEDMDTWAKAVGAATGPEGYAMAKILAGAAKFFGNAVKALQHNPDAKVYADDAKRLWVMIGQAGLAPPPYGPVSEYVFIETYKSNLYDTIDKLRTPERGLPWQDQMLELGYWTKRTITDPRVAAWYSALATGGRIGKTAGEIRGEGPPDLPGQYHGVASAESVWDASSAALAGIVAASVMGVPISGPVNAAVANLEGFTTRHPDAQHNETRDFNVAQIIATSEAWEAAKAQASKEAGRPFPTTGKIDAPWPMTGDI